MSAYIQLATPMTDRECLLDSLADLGFGRDVVEVHEHGQALVGFEGSQRSQTANIIVRRAHLGSASNDVGFVSTPTGYRLTVSDYDNARFGASWLAKLNTRYEHHRNEKALRMAEEQRRIEEEARRRLVEAQRQTVVEAAKKQGYRVEERHEQGRIRLVLSKRVY